MSSSSKNLLIGNKEYSCCWNQKIFPTGNKKYSLHINGPCNYIYINIIYLYIYYFGVQKNITNKCSSTKKRKFPVPSSVFIRVIKIIQNNSNILRGHDDKHRCVPLNTTTGGSLPSSSHDDAARTFPPLSDTAHRNNSENTPKRYIYK